jgi:trehalose synthase
MPLTVRPTMLSRVSIHPKPLARYGDVAEPALLGEIEHLAASLKGIRVLHLNATAYGGGVAELLLSLIPLESGLGLNAAWMTIGGDEQFFRTTKQLHNALQGQPWATSDAQTAAYVTANREAAEALGRFDVIIVHDPQPAAVRRFAGPRGARWVWRCHIDTSAPDESAWAFLQPYIQEYDAAVFTMAQFVPPGFSGPTLAFIAPAIDPLSSKNRELPADLSRAAVAEFGVDIERPLIVQVARFDPWKDPQGAIDAYRLAKKANNAVQLALIGSMASDDPEAWDVYRRVAESGNADGDLHVFTNLVGVGSLEVNCFQRAARVAMQKSTREGFGLAVSEALWKGTPVIGGAAGGIPLQLQDGVGGFLVSTADQAADRIIYLLEHPDEAAHIGEAGRRVVRMQFLLPRLLLDELRLIASLADASP